MKKFIFSAIFVCSFSLAFSQSFNHGAGVGIFVMSSPGADVTPAFSLSYSPRFNFVETEGMSVSIGVPVNIGFSGSYYAEYNSYYGGYEENTLGAFINAPAMLNLNLGAGSSKDNESRIGFFIGAGYGLHWGDFGTIVANVDSYQYTEKKYASRFGPAANAGLRIAVGSHQKNIEIRLSYMKISGGEKMNVYGVNTYFNF